MAAIRFNLKNPSSKNETAIFLIYQINPIDRLKLYTGYKIIPSQWSKKNMRAINNYDNQKLNLLLDSMESFTKQTTIELRINNKPINSDVLKKLISERFQLKANKSHDNKFINYIDTIINDRKNHPEFKINTIKSYKLFRSNLSKYDKNVTFENISLNWYNNFVKWMYSRGCSTNYVNNQTRKMKTFLQLGYDNGIHSNNAFLHKNFNTTTKKIIKIYNNENEIHQLYNYDYPKQYLRNAVNLYCIGCCTGLRYSDLELLDDKRDTIIISGHKYLKIHTVKTNDDLIIPYNDMLLDILTNQEYNIISNQKLNSYIKEAAELCGINEMVTQVTYPKGIAKRETVEKFKLMSAHTARRSFVTNMYIKGIPSQFIMKITGHKSEKTFMQYLSLSNVETAVLMNQYIEKM